MRCEVRGLSSWCEDTLPVGLLRATAKEDRGVGLLRATAKEGKGEGKKKKNKNPSNPAL